MSSKPPVLLYDGDCGFCRYWVDYWRALTGNSVEYTAYQDVLQNYPGLSAEECRRAIQLVIDDDIFSGADAAFRILAIAGHPVSSLLYRHLTPVSWLAEACYSFVSRRRVFADYVARSLWGRRRIAAQYHDAGWLFLRILGVIYFVAFASFGAQALGLIGANGILPLDGYLQAAHQMLGARAYYLMPSVFWFDASDTAIMAVCVGGAACGVAIAFGIWQKTALVFAYVFYLSLFYAGQAFMSFQWDILLIEVGVLAILLPLNIRWTAFLYRLLLFRFMFLSGCVKLLSGDPSWAALAALDFHYQTQPLPTVLAWYAHQLPLWFGHLCVAMTFVIELALPLLFFAPRRPRMLAAAGTLGLELVIIATGNYNFFNLLTIALCLFLFEDAQLRRLIPSRWSRSKSQRHATMGHRAPVAATILGGAILLSGTYHLVRPFLTDKMPAWAHETAGAIDPLRLTSGYGLFAVMTTKRTEIVVEGSHDGRSWTEYPFRYKPGDVGRAPRWNVPHQPRLDWQMWFAALNTAGWHPWFHNFLKRLLENEPKVTALLETNPFADNAPRYVRATLYDYRFSTPEQRNATGAWWSRTFEGLYHPPMQRR